MHSCSNNSFFFRCLPPFYVKIKQFSQCWRLCLLRKDALIINQMVNTHGHTSHTHSIQRIAALFVKRSMLAKCEDNMPVQQHIIKKKIPGDNDQTNANNDRMMSSIRIHKHTLQNGHSWESVYDWCKSQRIKYKIKEANKEPKKRNTYKKETRQSSNRRWEEILIKSSKS